MLKELLNEKLTEILNVMLNTIGTHINCMYFLSISSSLRRFCCISSIFGGPQTSLGLHRKAMIYYVNVISSLELSFLYYVYQLISTSNIDVWHHHNAACSPRPHMHWHNTPCTPPETPPQFAPCSFILVWHVSKLIDKSVEYE